MQKGMRCLGISQLQGFHTHASLLVLLQQMKIIPNKYSGNDWVGINEEAKVKR
jgi:hypothetical protein